jgi:hypothetical protein
MKIPAKLKPLVLATAEALDAMAKSENLSEFTRATLADLHRDWLRTCPELDKGGNDNRPQEK